MAEFAPQPNTKAVDMRWSLGKHHSPATWANAMRKRGWTPDQIDEAITTGSVHPAPNKINPGNQATRYIHPETGRSVVRDNVTQEILHVGGDDFNYD